MPAMTKTLQDSQMAAIQPEIVSCRRVYDMSVAKESLDCANVSFGANSGYRSSPIVSPAWGHGLTSYREGADVRDEQMVRITILHRGRRRRPRGRYFQ